MGTQRNVHYARHGAMIDGAWYPAMERCVEAKCKDATRRELARRLVVQPRGTRAPVLVRWLLSVVEV